MLCVSSSCSRACWAALTKLSVAFLTAFDAASSLFMLRESGSAFTLQAKRSCAVEPATCFAAPISFSSEEWPLT